MQLMCISGLKLYRLFLRLTQWESVFSFYKYDIKLTNKHCENNDDYNNDDDNS